uniref:Protein transport protein sec16 n=1 Tax=Hirondellea gigas TaxID=1518452 RepID=A0A6A7G2Q2_9CRUS
MADKEPISALELLNSPIPVFDTDELDDDDTDVDLGLDLHNFACGSSEESSRTEFDIPSDCDLRHISSSSIRLSDLATLSLSNSGPSIVSLDASDSKPLDAGQDSSENPTPPKKSLLSSSADFSLLNNDAKPSTLGITSSSRRLSVPSIVSSKLENHSVVARFQSGEPICRNEPIPSENSVSETVSDRLSTSEPPLSDSSRAKPNSDIVVSKPEFESDLSTTSYFQDFPDATELYDDSDIGGDFVVVSEAVEIVEEPPVLSKPPRNPSVLEFHHETPHSSELLDVSERISNGVRTPENLHSVAPNPYHPTHDPASVPVLAHHHLLGLAAPTKINDETSRTSSSIPNLKFDELSLDATASELSVPSLSDQSRPCPSVQPTEPTLSFSNSSVSQAAVTSLPSRSIIGQTQSVCTRSSVPDQDSADHVTRDARSSAPLLTSPKQVEETRASDPVESEGFDSYFGSDDDHEDWGGSNPVVEDQHIPSSNGVPRIAQMLSSFDTKTHAPEKAAPISSASTSLSTQRNPESIETSNAFDYFNDVDDFLSGARDDHLEFHDIPSFRQSPRSSTAKRESQELNHRSVDAVASIEVGHEISHESNASPDGLSSYFEHSNENLFCASPVKAPLDFNRHPSFPLASLPAISPRQTRVERESSLESHTAAPNHFPQSHASSHSFPQAEYLSSAEPVARSMPLVASQSAVTHQPSHAQLALSTPTDDHGPSSSLTPTSSLLPRDNLPQLGSTRLNQRAISSSTIPTHSFPPQRDSTHLTQPLSSSTTSAVPFARNNNPLQPSVDHRLASSATTRTESFLLPRGDPPQRSSSDYSQQDQYSDRSLPRSSCPPRQSSLPPQNSWECTQSLPAMGSSHPSFSRPQPPPHFPSHNQHPPNTQFEQPCYQANLHSASFPDLQHTSTAPILPPQRHSLPQRSSQRRSPQQHSPQQHSPQQRSPRQHSLSTHPFPPKQHHSPSTTSMEEIDLGSPPPVSSSAFVSNDHHMPYAPPPPHAIVNFGFGGKVVMMFPRQLRLLNSKRRPSDNKLRCGEIIVNSVNSILSKSELILSIQRFPTVLSKCNLSKVLDKLTNDGDVEVDDDFDDRTLLWKLLQYRAVKDPDHAAISQSLVTLLLKQNNGLPPKGSVEHLSLQRSVHAVDPNREQRQIVPMEDEEAATFEIQRLLLEGKAKEACRFAVDNELWPHALLLSSQCDMATYQTVVARIAMKLSSGSPLQTLYMLFADQSRHLFRGMQVGNQRFDRSGQPIGSEADLAQNWKRNLAILLANPTPNSASVIQELGDVLWRCCGKMWAAQFCYLCASDASNPFVPDGNPRIVLIGADHHLHPRTFISPTSVQMTELYEFGQKLSDSHYVFPPFQIYKFIYASMLADMGFPRQSLDYLEQIMNDVGHAEKQCLAMYTPAFSSGVKELHERLIKYLNIQERKKVKDWLSGLVTKATTVILGSERSNPPIPKETPRTIPQVQPSINHQNRLHRPGSISLMSSETPPSNAPMHPQNPYPSQRISQDPMPSQQPQIVSPPPAIISEPTNSSKTVDNSEGDKLNQKEKSGWFSWLSRTPKTSPPSANLTMDSKFYFDKEKNRWVMEGDDDLGEEEEVLAPPPTASEIQARQQKVPQPGDEGHQTTEQRVRSLGLPPSMARRFGSTQRASRQRSRPGVPGKLPPTSKFSGTVFTPRPPQASSDPTSSPLGQPLSNEVRNGPFLSQASVPTACQSSENSTPPTSHLTNGSLPEMNHSPVYQSNGFENHSNRPITSFANPSGRPAPGPSFRPHRATSMIPSSNSPTVQRDPFRPQRPGSGPDNLFHGDASTPPHPMTQTNTR